MILRIRPIPEGVTQQDFEATRWVGGQATNTQETIEIPAVIVDFSAPEDQPPGAELHRYVKAAEQQTLSKCCTERRGISKTMVAGQQTIQADLAESVMGVEQQPHLTINEKGFNFVMCTDGGCDVGEELPAEIKRKRLAHLVPEYLKRG